VPKPTPSTPDIDPQFPVGPFSLTERSGKTITDADLRGKVWIASFVFTRCTGPCPAVTSTMTRLQSELSDELKAGKVKLVTFTVDPARDDMSSLREYANLRGADANNWLFLTGDEGTVHKLLASQFKQGVERHTGADVQPGDEFEHSTRLLVIDTENVIRGIYPGLRDEKQHNPDATFTADLERLKARVRGLLK